MKVMRFMLDDPPFAGRYGHGVTVAVVDSGIHAAHPHVGGVSGGACLLPGEQPGDVVDRIGHGTAVAAAIREKAPGVELLAVRVLDRKLATSAQALADGIAWAADRGARLINLSLGTANETRRHLLEEAVDHAARRGAIVVTARTSDGVEWLPGAFPTVVGVVADWNCRRDQLDVRSDDGATPVFYASGYPRPIPGVPRERNLSGTSFSVANVTGFLARMLEGRARWTIREVGQALGTAWEVPSRTRTYGTW